jgi:hypothetical protein
VASIIELRPARRHVPAYFLSAKGGFTLTSKFAIVNAELWDAFSASVNKNRGDAGWAASPRFRSRRSYQKGVRLLLIVARARATNQKIERCPAVQPQVAAAQAERRSPLGRSAARRRNLNPSECVSRGASCAANYTRRSVNSVANTASDRTGCASHYIARGIRDAANSVAYATQQAAATTTA